MPLQLNRATIFDGHIQTSNEKYIANVNLLCRWHDSFMRGNPMVPRKMYELMHNRIRRHERGKKALYLPFAPFRTGTIDGIDENWNSGYIEGSWIRSLDCNLNIDLSKFARKNTLVKEMPDLSRKYHHFLFPSTVKFDNIDALNKWKKEKDIQDMVFRDVVGGLEISLTYREGILCSSLTKYGRSVSDIVSRVIDIPNEIFEDSHVEIRGKLTLPTDILPSTNTERILTKLILENEGDRKLLKHLKFIADDVWGMEELDIYEKEEFLVEEGFEVLPYFNIPNNRIFGIFKDRLENRLTLPCDYTVRGVAIEALGINDIERLGYVRNIPQFKCELLFPEEEETIIVEYVDWDMDPKGYYTPCLIGSGGKSIDYVDAKTIRELDIGVGSKLTTVPVLANAKDKYSWSVNDDIYSISPGKAVKTKAHVIDIDTSNSRSIELMENCVHCNGPLYEVKGKMRCPAKFCPGRFKSKEVKHPVFKEEPFKIRLIGILDKAEMNYIRRHLKEAGYEIIKNHKKADLVVILDSKDRMVNKLFDHYDIPVMDLKKKLFHKMDNISKEHIVNIAKIVRMEV